MRVLPEPNLPVYKGGDEYQKSLTVKLTMYLRQIAQQLNLASEGYLQGATNADIAAPTTGTYQKGDFIRNSSPSEAGTAGSKYVVFGWVCVTAGTPGTWVDCRFLTGN